MRLAALAARLPSVEDGLLLLPLLAPGRHLGEDALSPAPASASAPEEDIKLLLDTNARDRQPERLSHLWLDAGYTAEEKGAGWVHKVLGWTAEIVRHPKKLAPEGVMRAWVKGVQQGRGRHRFGEAYGAERP